MRTTCDKVQKVHLPRKSNVQPISNLIENYRSACSGTYATVCKFGKVKVQIHRHDTQLAGVTYRCLYRSHPPIIAIMAYCMCDVMVNRYKGYIGNPPRTKSNQVPNDIHEHLIRLELHTPPLPLLCTCINLVQSQIVWSKYAGGDTGYKSKILAEITGYTV